MSGIKRNIRYGKWGRLKGDPIQERDYLPVPKNMALAIYAALLSELSFEEMVEFWGRLPLNVNGKDLFGEELFEYMWHTKQTVPNGWIIGILLEMEPYLINKGINFSQFLNKVNLHINQTSFLPGRVALFWIKPILSKVHKIVDTRSLSLQAICLAIENHTKGSIHKVVKSEKDGKMIQSTVAHILQDNYDYYYPNDYNFFYSFFATITPKMFGAPPFDRSDFLADARPVEWVLQKDNMNYRFSGNELYIGSECIAVRSSFHKFVESIGLDLEEYKFPNNRIYIMKKDLYSDKIKRVILHKGCAYGAPLYLIRHIYQYKEASVQDNLTHFVDDIAVNEPVVWKEVELLHKNFLKQLRSKWEFIFYEKPERITLNEKLVTRGVTALILRKILKNYLESGKTEFSYKDFREDDTIFSKMKDANLEMRISRLLKNSAKAMGDDVLFKSGRGKVTFQPHHPLEFKEV